MKRMKLSELTGNEILAQSLMTWDYQIILPEGAVLKKEYIDKIEEMGILEVYVKEDEANEIVILKNDIEKTIKSKVKSILERHTYQNNKELQGLTQAADEIITNILDEKDQCISCTQLAHREYLGNCRPHSRRHQRESNTQNNHQTNSYQPIVNGRNSINKVHTYQHGSSQYHNRSRLTTLIYKSAEYRGQDQCS